MRDHRKLRTFELADQLVLSIYRVTKTFPKEELFGLTSQMRRSAVSSAANIVEGSARNSQIDYVRFLDMAHASLRELGYYIDLSYRLGYMIESSFEKLNVAYEQTARSLGALIRSLRNRS